MTDLNAIRWFPASEEAYIVLDQESGDFQEVHSSIGHALSADLKTVTVKLFDDNDRLVIECGDTCEFLDMEEVRELADNNGEKFEFAVKVFIMQHIPYLNNESVAELMKGIRMREGVHIIHAGFAF